MWLGKRPIGLRRLRRRCNKNSFICLPEQQRAITGGFCRGKVSGFCRPVQLQQTRSVCRSYSVRLRRKILTYVVSPCGGDGSEADRGLTDRKINDPYNLPKESCVHASVRRTHGRSVICGAVPEQRGNYPLWTKRTKPCKRKSKE